MLLILFYLFVLSVEGETERRGHKGIKDMKEEREGAKVSERE